MGRLLGLSPSLVSALTFLIVAITAASLFSAALPVASSSYPTGYDVFLGVHDFREADHSANISISFTAEIPMISGRPGQIGLIAQNTFGGNGYAVANGTCVDQACTSAFWQFNFYARFTASGAPDFYPYDAWMLNITLTTPLVFEANKTNTSIGARSYVPGWEFKGEPDTRVVSSEAVVVTMILQRASWTAMPVRFVPLVLFLILGFTPLIPADDLASKTTVVTSVIFFIAASIFSLGPSLPPRFYGPSFAETVFFYLLLLAAVYLGESILESRTIVQRKVKRKIARKRDLSRFLMQAGVVLLAIYWIWTYTESFSSLALSYYPWSAPNLLETRSIPILGVTLGTLVNVIVDWLKTVRQ